MATLDLKSKKQVLVDLIDMVRVNSNITDFNFGSVIYTILESVAVELEAGQAQLLRALQAFSYKTSPGADLDNRAADYDIYRNSAAKAYGNVIFLNTDLPRAYISGNVITAGAIELYVDDVTGLGAAPFDIVLGEGTDNEEIVTVASVVLATNKLVLDVLTPTVYDHYGLSHASMVGVTNEYYLDAARCGGLIAPHHVDRTIPAGVIVSAPGVGNLPSVKFFTTSEALIEAGKYKSTVSGIIAESPGPLGNVGVGRIRVVTYGVPTFTSGLGVYNYDATGGGIPTETDDAFADRISRTLGSLSRGTKQAVLSFLKDAQVASTGQRAVRVGIEESFAVDPLVPGYASFKIYVDDGSGNFQSSIEENPLGVLIGNILAGVLTISFTTSNGEFPEQGFLYILDTVVAANSEIVEYESITAGPPTAFNLVSATLKAHAAATTLMYFVQRIVLSSNSKKRFYKLQHIALVDSTMALLYENILTSSPVSMVKFDPLVNSLTTSDFILNAGTGEVEILAASMPIDDSSFYVFYDRYTGLVEEAQRLLDGDLLSPTGYSGIRAAGVRSLVLPATQILVSIKYTLQYEEGVNITSIREFVANSLSNYINSLDVDEDVIVEKMDSIALIPGVSNLKRYYPTVDVIIGPSEVAVADTPIIF